MEAELITFAAIAFVFFIDRISITNIISSHSITEVSAILKSIALALLTNTCASILTIIIFTCKIIFKFTLTCFIIPFLIEIAFFNTEFAFTIT